MPRRNDFHSVLIIGSGPIVIGQACEFDYSGTQACRALKEEGYRVILINSNPATIMTDPDLVDATYIEPISANAIEAVMAQEHPDVLLPTMGGQTALNMAMTLHRRGILEKYGVRLIGANVQAIHKAEDRDAFREAMARIGAKVPRSGIATSVEEARGLASELGLPLIIRPSFTLGGTGGGIAHTRAELAERVRQALVASPTHQVLIEESVLGWKEYELEVMRDTKDNVVIICSIENLDPMGVHTGDSITVAPAQTLTDREYQHLRDLSIAIIREIGVDTGGSNIQFAVNPADGEVAIIEMNPRVSRSSALASKATGFPIAKIAAKLAVGYTLDELPNDITRKTPASFEPSIDYVVTKIPRFNFEKFPLSDARLTTQMKSVGEVMAIGRVFRESLQKALRSLENGLTGLDELTVSEMELSQTNPSETSPSERAAVEMERPAEDQQAALLRERLRYPDANRLRYLAAALRLGWSEAHLHELTGIDPWFLAQIASLIAEEQQIRQQPEASLEAGQLRYWKSLGFSDARIASLSGTNEGTITAKRVQAGVRPVFKKVDTCAAEFAAATPYFYSTYEQHTESIPEAGRKVAILGSGPNRIGQGIEFDYCCVHAALALRERGYQSIMINCNPETVSTDYDISSRLYFEPITFEDVMEILAVERPDGVILQLGGQTPLKLAQGLAAAGVRILGTTHDSIDRTEDRERFAELVEQLGLDQPPNGLATSLEEARAIGARIGYPLLVRPSYVLGGRAMEIVRDESHLAALFNEAQRAAPQHPVLIDKFLIGATEVDVDVLGDGTTAVVAGILEHIELAGVHSGDSACSLPPHSLSPVLQREIARQAVALALELKVVGLMNAQFAVQDGRVFLIEVNPRASRTVPFVSKATGSPLAKHATWLMLGERLQDLGVTTAPLVPFSVKETVLPFGKFSGTDTTLGPEMRSTGEVMGRGETFSEAFLKAQIAASNGLPPEGYVFIGVTDEDKPLIIPLARALQGLGYQLLATPGTRRVLLNSGLSDITETSLDIESPQNVFAHMVRDTLALVINTHSPRQRRIEETHLRRLMLAYKIPYCSTLEAAETLVNALVEVGPGRNFSYTPLKGYAAAQEPRPPEPRAR